MCEVFRVFYICIVSWYLPTVTISPLPFQYGYLSFLIWLLGLRLQIPCLIKVVRVGILVSFQISARRLSSFHSWVLFCLWFVINNFFMLIYVPSISTLVKVVTMNGCWILSSVFLHLLKWLRDICLFFYWHSVSHWLICICWSILVTLEWTQLDYGIWFFICTVGFNLLNFAKDFFIYIHQRYCMAYNFVVLLLLSLLVSLSGFGIRVIVDSWNDFGSDPYSSMIWKCLRRISISSSLCVLYFPSEPLWSWPLFEGSFFLFVCFVFKRSFFTFCFKIKKKTMKIMWRGQKSNFEKQKLYCHKIVLP